MASTLQICFLRLWVPNPRRSSACDCTCVLTRIDHCLVNYRSCRACQMCSVFVLTCAKSAHVFQKLSYSLCGLRLSFPTNNSSSDSKAFLRFIAFSGSQTAVHRAFLFFDAKAWPVTNWPLHVHYGITLCTYLSQTHRPILHSIACTTVLHCGHTSLNLS